MKCITEDGSMCCSQYETCTNPMYHRLAGCSWEGEGFIEWPQEPEVLDDETPTLCGDCRHWVRGFSAPASAVLGQCRVSGSFRAPGGLFTECDFCCCHWTKS